MPWRECNVMDERVKFVARLLEGEKMAALCREFDISRKTGYKILERYEGTGLEGLTDRSRRPYRHANQLPFQIEALIVRLKHEKPSWGAPKIAELLARRYPDVHRPAISTIHAVLDRRGLVKHRKGRKNKAVGAVLSNSEQPNDLWCALRFAQRPVQSLEAVGVVVAAGHWHRTDQTPLPDSGLLANRDRG
jgi:putative transposase